jgi:hypothetical protein
VSWWCSSSAKVASGRGQTPGLQRVDTRAAEGRRCAGAVRGETNGGLSALLRAAAVDH